MRALWYIFLSLWLTAIAVDSMAHAQPIAPATGAMRPPVTLPATATSGNSCLGPAGLPPRGANTPAPGNPGEKICEDGRIHLRSGALRRYGHRIMDLVRATVLIEHAPEIAFDLQSLGRGVIGFNGQEFDLADPQALAPGESPVVVSARPLENGNNLLRIDLILQTSVPASVTPYVVFRMDLRYSPGYIVDNNGSPTAVRDWRVLTTPDTAVTLSATAMPGDSMIGPTLEEVPTPAPWPMWSLLVGGIFLAGLWPGILVVRWINRVRPGRKISARELAWRRIAPVISAGRKYGFTYTHFKEIASAIRRCFSMDAATNHEARELSKDWHESEEIMRVLAICDRALFEAHNPSEEEIAHLIADIKLLLALSH